MLINEREIELSREQKSDGFKVSGHLRLQRYGEQKSKVKLIYIDEFEKQGYTRTAKSIAN